MCADCTGSATNCVGCRGSNRNANCTCPDSKFDDGSSADC